MKTLKTVQACIIAFANFQLGIPQAKNDGSGADIRSTVAQATL